MRSRTIVVLLVVILAAASFSGANELLVNTSSKYGGIYGMRVVVSDTSPAYVETDSPTAETTITFRFYVNANCLNLANGSNFSLFEGSDLSEVVWVRVVIEMVGADPAVYFEARKDDSTYSSSLMTVLPSGWHMIEVTWKAGSPGSLTAGMDNWAIDGIDSITNSNGVIDVGRMGAVSGIDGGTSGFIKFDDFASFRTDSTIGPVSVFGDISSSYTFFPEIHALYGSGVTGGCGSGNYCADTSVTRGQMAAFILRAENLSVCFYDPPAGPGTPTFGDVGTGHQFYDLIEEFSAQGFTSGCGGGNYCPDSSVTRGQMSVFLLRGKYGTGFSPPACSGDSGFTDVPDSHPFCGWIKKLAEDGITGGCGGGNYCPESPVTRGTMAAFLQRTYGLIRVLP